MFFKLLNMSITASYLVVIVIILRLLLKKAPKQIICALWLLVAVRLCCPFSFESPLSVIPSGEILPPSTAPQPAQSIQASATQPVAIAEYIWITGMIAMLLFALISVLRIKSKVKESVPLKENIRVCDHIASPFIFGLFRPRIYIPPYIRQKDLEYVLLHEKAHLKRCDHIWKPFGYILLTVYWFNPLLWAAYALLCRDIELACDEKVIRQLGADAKKPYATALINCSVPRKTIAACPLAFGETGIKTRIKNVLSYKKPTFWLLLIAAIACIATAVFFMTSPPSEKIDDSLQTFLEQQVAERGNPENFRTASCKILGVETHEDTKTVFMWTLTQEYNADGQLDAAAHIPMAITVQTTDGQYRILEYWQPRDGSYYADDIKAKFPLRLWQKAFDSQKVLPEQEEICQKRAERYFSQTIYTFYESPEQVIKPYIGLAKDGTFTFTWSAFSSYIAYGKYEKTGNRLLLKTEDGVYVFTENSPDEYTFNASESAPIPEYKYTAGAQPQSPVPDGSVFKR